MMINWGRPGWKFLHSVTFAYPEKPSLRTKVQYMKFFKSLQYVLPCPRCRLEYSRAVRKLTLRHLKNTETLSRWLVCVHNQINVKLRKAVVPFDEVKKMYV